MKSSDEAARILSSYTDPSVQLEAEIDALKEDWYENWITFRSIPLTRHSIR